jgi:hypothetical protein
VTEENPRPAGPEDVQLVSSLPLESEERRMLAETLQSLPAQPEDAQQTAEQLFPGGPAGPAIWNLPVESEERRKLAEAAQSTPSQHDAPETNTK